MLERGRKTIRPQYFSTVSPPATQAGWDLHRANSSGWRKVVVAGWKGTKSATESFPSVCAARSGVLGPCAPGVCCPLAVVLPSCTLRERTWEPLGLGGDASCLSRPESWAEEANLFAEGSGPGNGAPWRLTMQRSLVVALSTVLPLRKGRCGLTALSTKVHAWFWTWLLGGEEKGVEGSLLKDPRWGGGGLLQQLLCSHSSLASGDLWGRYSFIHLLIQQILGWPKTWFGFSCSVCVHAWSVDSSRPHGL